MRKINYAISLLMTGLVSGLVIGVLFAPYKGSKTRRKIARKGEEIKDEIRGRFHRFSDIFAKTNGKTHATG